MMETVFVTGGGSQLGQHVLRRLMSRMRILAVVHRRKIDLPGAEMELLHGGLEETIRNPIALKSAHSTGLSPRRFDRVRSGQRAGDGLFYCGGHGLSPLLGQNVHSLRRPLVRGDRDGTRPPQFGASSLCSAGASNDTSPGEETWVACAIQMRSNRSPCSTKNL